MCDPAQKVTSNAGLCLFFAGFIFLDGKFHAEFIRIIHAQLTSFLSTPTSSRHRLKLLSSLMPWQWVLFFSNVISQKGDWEGVLLIAE